MSNPTKEQLTRSLPALRRLRKFGTKALNIEDVATVLGVSVTTVHSWRNSWVGQFLKLPEPTLQAGRTVRWSAKSIQQFVLSHAMRNSEELGRRLMDERQTNIREAERKAGLLTASEVAVMVGISISTLYSWLSQGYLPKPIKGTDNSSRWRREVIQTWVAGGCKFTPAALGFKK